MKIPRVEEKGWRKEETVVIFFFSFCLTFLGFFFFSIRKQTETRLNDTKKKRWEYQQEMLFAGERKNKHIKIYVWFVM